MVLNDKISEVVDMEITSESSKGTKHPCLRSFQLTVASVETEGIVPTVGPVLPYQSDTEGPIWTKRFGA